MKKGLECSYDARRRGIPETKEKEVEEVSIHEEAVFPEPNSPKPPSTPHQSSALSSSADMILQPYSVTREIPMVMETGTYDFLVHGETFNLDFLQDNSYNYESGKEIQPRYRTPPPIFSPLSPMSSFLSLSSPSHFKRNTGHNSVQQVFLTMMIDLIQAYPRM